MTHIPKWGWGPTDTHSIGIQQFEIYHIGHTGSSSCRRQCTRRALCPLCHGFAEPKTCTPNQATFLHYWNNQCQFENQRSKNSKSIVLYHYIQLRIVSAVGDKVLYPIRERMVGIISDSFANTPYYQLVLILLIECKFLRSVLANTRQQHFSFSMFITLNCRK